MSPTEIRVEIKTIFTEFQNMAAAISKEWVPTTLEGLQRFANSGSILIIETIFRLEMAALERLDEDGRRALVEIQRRLNQWKAIEDEHGEGSALNPAHTILLHAISGSEKLQQAYAPLLANADRYKAIMGQNWHWSSSKSP
ncbi:hypothetical protein G6L00_09760 [Agrobacterium rhizogenes]|nr:hypothetical protein [Rhizobium rhizogenes]NTH38213.1 hypothetical protein [Rhizobium rhizogenes]NTJ00616.1 hypothetical protein [Rhizobium rhizogenes]